MTKLYAMGLAAEVIRAGAKLGTALVIGECLCGAVSRPLHAWRHGLWKEKQIITTTNNEQLEKLAELLDVFNQRLCDVEDKLGITAEKEAKKDTDE